MFIFLRLRAFWKRQQFICDLYLTTYDDRRFEQSVIVVEKSYTNIEGGQHDPVSILAKTGLLLKMSLSKYTPLLSITQNVV